MGWISVSVIIFLLLWSLIWLTGVLADAHNSTTEMANVLEVVTSTAASANGNSSEEATNKPWRAAHFSRRNKTGRFNIKRVNITYKWPPAKYLSRNFNMEDNSSIQSSSGSPRFSSRKGMWAYIMAEMERSVLKRASQPVSGNLTKRNVAFEGRSFLIPNAEVALLNAEFDSNLRHFQFLPYPRWTSLPSNAGSVIPAVDTTIQATTLGSVEKGTVIFNGSTDSNQTEETGFGPKTTASELERTEENSTEIFAEIDSDVNQVELVDRSFFSLNDTKFKMASLNTANLTITHLELVGNSSNLKTEKTEFGPKTTASELERTEENSTEILPEINSDVNQEVELVDQSSFSLNDTKFKMASLNTGNLTITHLELVGNSSNLITFPRDMESHEQIVEIYELFKKLTEKIRTATLKIYDQIKNIFGLKHDRSFSLELSKQYQSSYGFNATLSNYSELETANGSLGRDFMGSDEDWKTIKSEIDALVEEVELLVTKNGGPFKGIYGNFELPSKFKIFLNDFYSSHCIDQPIVNSTRQPRECDVLLVVVQQVSQKLTDGNETRSNLNEPSLKLLKMALQLQELENGNKSLVANFTMPLSNVTSLIPEQMEPRLEVIAFNMLKGAHAIADDAKLHNVSFTVFSATTANNSQSSTVGADGRALDYDYDPDEEDRMDLKQEINQLVNDTIEEMEFNERLYDFGFDAFVDAFQTYLNKTYDQKCRDSSAPHCKVLLSVIEQCLNSLQMVNFTQMHEELEWEKRNARFQSNRSALAGRSGYSFTLNGTVPGINPDFFDLDGTSKRQMMIHNESIERQLISLPVESQNLKMESNNTMARQLMGAAIPVANRNLEMSLNETKDEHPMDIIETATTQLEGLSIPVIGQNLEININGTMERQLLSLNRTTGRQFGGIHLLVASQNLEMDFNGTIRKDKSMEFNGTSERQLDGLPISVASQNLEMGLNDTLERQLGGLPISITSQNLEMGPNDTLTRQLGGLPISIASQNLEMGPNDTLTRQLGGLPISIARQNLEMGPNDTLTRQLGGLPISIASQNLEMGPNDTLTRQLGGLPISIASQNLEMGPNDTLTRQLGGLPISIASQNLEMGPNDTLTRQLGGPPIPVVSWNLDMGQNGTIMQQMPTEINETVALNETQSRQLGGLSIPVASRNLEMYFNATVGSNKTIVRQLGGLSLPVASQNLEMGLNENTSMQSLNLNETNTEQMGYFPIPAVSSQDLVNSNISSENPATGNIINRLPSSELDTLPESLLTESQTTFNSSRTVTYNPNIALTKLAAKETISTVKTYQVPSNSSLMVSYNTDIAATKKNKIFEIQFNSSVTRDPNMLIKEARPVTKQNKIFEIPFNSSVTRDPNMLIKEARPVTKQNKIFEIPFNSSVTPDPNMLIKEARPTDKSHLNPIDPFTAEELFVALTRPAIYGTTLPAKSYFLPHNTTVSPTSTNSVALNKATEIVSPTTKLLTNATRTQTTSAELSIPTSPAILLSNSSNSSPSVTSNSTGISLTTTKSASRPFTIDYENGHGSFHIPHVFGYRKEFAEEHKEFHGYNVREQEHHYHFGSFQPLNDAKDGPAKPKVDTADRRRVDFVFSRPLDGTVHRNYDGKSEEEVPVHGDDHFKVEKYDHGHHQKYPKFGRLCSRDEECSSRFNEVCVKRVYEGTCGCPTGMRPDFHTRICVDDNSMHTANGYISRSKRNLLAVSNTVNCPHNCSNHGDCFVASDNSTSCNCNNWYFGERCQMDAIVGILSLIAGVCAVAVAVFICSGLFCWQHTTSHRRWIRLSQ